MIRLKYLPVLTVAAAIGFALNPSSVKAATINSTLDLNFTTGTVVNFEVLDRPIAPGITLTGTAYSAAGNFILDDGKAYSGVLIYLTGFELFNNSGATYSNADFLTLSSTVTGYNVGVGNYVAVRHALSGDITSNASGGNVTAGTKFTYTASVPNPIAPLQFQALPVSTATQPSPLTFNQTAYAGSPYDPSFNNPTVTGRLTNVNLASGEKLSLPNSACTVMIDTGTTSKASFDLFPAALTQEAAERACQSVRPKPVPEPAAGAGLLALGAVGLVSMTRRKKVTALLPDRTA